MSKIIIAIALLTFILAVVQASLQNLLAVNSILLSGFCVVIMIRLSNPGKE